MASKWNRVWLIAGLIFLTVETTLKVAAELYTPDFLIVDFSPYLTIGATHYRNANSCLGVLRGFPDLVKFLVTASASVVLFAFAAFCHFAEVGLNVRRAVMFLLFGGIGNLLDRLALGVVVDYVDITLGDNGQWLYLAWNLSDLAINVGVFFLLRAHWENEAPFNDSKPTFIADTKVKAQ